MSATVRAILVWPTHVSGVVASVVVVVGIVSPPPCFDRWLSVVYIYTIRVELFGKKKEEEGEYIYNPFRFKWGGSFPVDLLKFLLLLSL